LTEIRRTSSEDKKEKDTEVTEEETGLAMSIAASGKVEEKVKKSGKLG
jgi:hypothetical protein